MLNMLTSNMKAAVSQNTPRQGRESGLDGFTFIVTPGPSMAWVLLDEHPDSINDCLFSVLMTGTTWTDLSASYRNSPCGYSFADGHEEIKRWRDANTVQPVLHINPSAGNRKSSPYDMV